MANPVEDIISRVATSVKAGSVAFDEGVNEAVRCIEDLFKLSPHSYDVDKVAKAVQDRMKK